MKGTLQLTQFDKDKYTKTEKQTNLTYNYK